MCSGCSGDYAGGFESDDPDADDRGDPMADAGDGATDASFRGTRETDWGETDLAQGTGCWPASLEVPEDALESCEILVTGTHIFEIRVIFGEFAGQRSILEYTRSPGAAYAEPAFAWGECQILSDAPRQ